MHCTLLSHLELEHSGALAVIARGNCAGVNIAHRGHGQRHIITRPSLVLDSHLATCFPLTIIICCCLPRTGSGTTVVAQHLLIATPAHPRQETRIAWVRLLVAQSLLVVALLEIRVCFLVLSTLGNWAKSSSKRREKTGTCRSKSRAKVIFTVYLRPPKLWCPD